MSFRNLSRGNFGTILDNPSVQETSKERFSGHCLLAEPLINETKNARNEERKKTK